MGIPEQRQGRYSLLTYSDRGREGREMTERRRGMHEEAEYY